MGKYLGDFVEDAIVRGSFNTRDAAGAPITLAGTPAVSVYKDAGATESTAGVTLTVDFDSRTGHHIYTIDTSADAFYATGADYRVVLTAGTVDGVSVVGVEVGAFSIQNRFIRSEPPTAAGNATQVRTELAAELAQIDATNDRTSLIYTLLQLTDADVAVLVARIAGTIRTAADDVTAETAQTADVRSGLATATNVSDAQTAIANILGTPSGASLAADIAAIELDPEIIVNPTELSNESIEAIDEYFWENHRFKATIDSETGQFVIWVKNEDGEKIATLAKQEEIIEDIAGIEGGGGGAGDTAEEIVDEIVARGITAIPVQSGVTSAGNLDLIQGDTYNGTAKPLLSFPTSADYTSGWAATLTIRDTDDAVVATAAGVVASATQVTVSLTAPTGLVFEGCPGVWQGKFDVEVSKGTQRATIARGVAYINEDQTR
jgi:hypothetical protein